MNRKFFLIFVCIVIVSIFQPLAAQSQSNLLLWGLGTYGNWNKTGNDALKPRNIYGGGAGIGYEYWHKVLILGVGAELLYRQMNLTYSNSELIIDSIADDEGDFYIGSFNYSDIKDKTNYANLQIPLYVGVQNKNFYALAAGKIGLNVYGTTTISYSRVLSGDYYNYLGVFQDMPNHRFDESRHEKTQDIQFATTFAGSLEAGIKFPVQDRFNKKPVTFRLGVFFDYTLNSMLLPKETPFVYNAAEKTDLNGYQFFEPCLENLLLSNQTRKAVIAPLMGGVKLTVLFRIKDREPCNCEWD